MSTLQEICLAYSAPGTLMEDEITFISRRQRMVDEQLRERDIYDERVLAAMAKVPRHLFVPPEYRSRAYADGPLPIGEGQTISQPFIVALMTQMLDLQGRENVLEIGTGSGYQAAILACLGREVQTVERHEALGKQAAQILQELGLTNVHVHIGDGSGWGCLARDKRIENSIVKGGRRWKRRR